MHAGLSSSIALPPSQTSHTECSMAPCCITASPNEHRCHQPMTIERTIKSAAAMIKQPARFFKHSGKAFAQSGLKGLTSGRPLCISAYLANRVSLCLRSYNYLHLKSVPFGVYVCNDLFQYVFAIQPEGSCEVRNLQQEMWLKEGFAKRW